MTVARKRHHHTAPSGHRGNVVCTAALLLSGILSIITPMGIASARDAPRGHLTVVDRYAADIADGAQRFGIPVAWIRSVMRVESRGNVRAVSPVGAMGLMQIMPATWSDIRTRHGLGNDPFDPRDNILAGAAYLREMYDRYGSPGFLAAYNAGPGRYEKSLAGERALPAETRAYVARLVPLMGGGEVGRPVVTKLAARTNWSNAPLFVARGESTPVAHLAQPDHPSNAAPETVSARDLSAISPQANGLFVDRSSSGGL